MSANKKMKSRRIGLVIAFGLSLGLGAFAWGQGGAASQEEKVGVRQPEQRQDWQHPSSGEKVTLWFDGQQTKINRGQKTDILPPPAFNEAEEMARTREMLKEQFRWDVLSVPRWRNEFVSGAANLAEAKKAFQAQGFPLKLWDDIDAFLQATGRRVPTDGPPTMPENYAGGLTVAGDGTVMVTRYQAGKPVESVIHLNDPQWKDNLLIHPTPELQARYENLYLTQPVGVSPPSADTPFREQSSHLRRQGYLRLTSRQGGRLWLPAALEPHRAALEASEKPVLRLGANVGHQPQLWDSKVGGVPYRPKGAAWPMSTEKHPRPLVFLAQVNLGQVNKGGQALPDFPHEGLLQFFILNSEFMGADAMFGTDGGNSDLSGVEGNYRVLYIPHVIQDASKLETGVPKPEYNPDEVARLKASGYTSLIGDTSLIWDLLPFDNVKSFPPPAVALNYVADREPVSGADNLATTVLGKDLWKGAETGADPASELYDLSPGGHKVGGYPDFTQNDPRRNPKDWVLLFQLDSDPALNLMWGDVGTANFFIRPADLKKQDFSHVAYHWDSG